MVSKGCEFILMGYRKGLEFSTTNGGSIWRKQAHSLYWTMLSMQMRPLLTTALLILSVYSFGQLKEEKVKLADDVTVTFIKARFDPKGKKIEVSDNVVISIDNKLVFGTDGEMPTTYLKKATLTIGNKNYDLQVDGMYNPWLENYFNNKVFKLKIEGKKYRITGGFSDGAGYYVVEWVAFGQGIIRTVLTNDEKFIEGMGQ